MASESRSEDLEVDVCAEEKPFDFVSHYDAAIVYAEKNGIEALGIMEEMNLIELDNSEHPKVCLFTDPVEGASEIAAGEAITKICTLIFVLVTAELHGDDIAQLIKDEAIGNTRLAKKCHPGLKYCVRPLYIEKDPDFRPPCGLSAIQPVRWWDKESRFFKRQIKLLFQHHLPYRKQRERRQRDFDGDHGNMSSVPLNNLGLDRHPSHVNTVNAIDNLALITFHNSLQDISKDPIHLVVNKSSEMSENICISGSQASTQNSKSHGTSVTSLMSDDSGIKSQTASTFSPVLNPLIETKSSIQESGNMSSCSDETGSNGPNGNITEGENKSGSFGQETFLRSNGDGSQERLGLIGKETTGASELSTPLAQEINTTFLPVVGYNSGFISFNVNNQGTGDSEENKQNIMDEQMGNHCNQMEQNQIGSLTDHIGRHQDEGEHKEHSDTQIRSHEQSSEGHLNGDEHQNIDDEEEVSGQLMETEDGRNPSEIVGLTASAAQTTQSLEFGSSGNLTMDGGAMSRHPFHQTRPADRPEAVGPEENDINRDTPGPPTVVVHYHNHFHGDVIQGQTAPAAQQVPDHFHQPSGTHDGGQINNGGPPINIVGCSNVQIGINNSTTNRSAVDTVAQTSAIAELEEPPPSYTELDPLVDHDLSDQTEVKQFYHPQVDALTPVDEILLKKPLNDLMTDGLESSLHSLKSDSLGVTDLPSTDDLQDFLPSEEETSEVPTTTVTAQPQKPSLPICRLFCRHRRRQDMFVEAGRRLLTAGGPCVGSGCDSDLD